MTEGERRASLLARMGELERALRQVELELEALDGAPLLAAGPFDMLVCRIGVERVGFVETEVERVVPSAELAPAVDAPPWVLGLLNLHGTFLPVVSIMARAGRLQRELELTDSIIIANLNARRVGLLVDETLGMRSVTGGAVQSPLHRGIFTNFVLGLVPDDDGLISILSVERLMSSAEAIGD